ncbi:hypothetical protein [Nocardioides exalbidus]|uniref:hypothetical protein n=1 Tax=Nocardioides exalbidus TaxID=402596 RepID=UPI001115488F|nr:hypothetical protein [Nocardioides exalbidus]
MTRFTGAATRAQTAMPAGRSRLWLPLGIFVASRIVSSVMLLVAGSDQVTPPGWTSTWPDDPSGSRLLVNWDGYWYRTIAIHGYPTELPRNGDGVVVQNAWAFYPIVPALARLVMTTGLDYAWAAAAVATLASGAACTLLFGMVRERSDSFTASLTVAVLVLGPVGLVFQTAYTEGPALLVVLLALRSLGARRWGRVVAYGLLLSLTRPVTLALAAACGALWVVLWWRRRTEPFPVRDRIGLAAATVAVAASFLVWPTVAGVVTGEGDAYRLTQAAWVTGTEGWTTWLSGTAGLGASAATVLGVVVLVFVGWFVLRRDAAAWPLEGRLWAGLYTLYILAATRPTASVVRYLALAAFPSWPLPEVSQRCRTTRSRIALAVPVVVACCLAQWLWTSLVWVPHGPVSITP